MCLTYDDIGNITSSIYIDEKGEKHSDTYKYDKDNLTKFNGEKVDGYSGGNPKTYLGYTLKWAHGRQLASATPTNKKKRTDSDAHSVTYSYAYDGSRLSKTVGKTSKSAGTTTEYILNGSTILAQNTTYANGEIETLNFYYSSDGKLIEIGYLKYDGADGSSGLKDATENHYSVIRNAMGDVAALYTADGTLVGTYEYDPYGLPLATTENTAYTDADGILEKNPFRYRGYYYDSETGWYYLQSRYYDPDVKRFINADSVELLTTDCMNLMQYSLFMYCYGDPINKSDDSGHFPLIAGIIIAGGVVGALSGALNSYLSGGNVWEGAIEGGLTGLAGSAISVAVGVGAISGLAAFGLGVLAGSVIDAGVQVGVQIVDDGHAELSEINPTRVLKSGIETGALTSLPCLDGFRTDPAMAFGTGLISGEGTVVTSIFDGAITNMFNQ